MSGGRPSSGMNGEACGLAHLAATIVTSVQPVHLQVDLAGSAAELSALAG